MLAKRLIPCLDIKAGRTVKGTNFEGLRDMGEPAELAERYSAEGADELVFLDISATIEERATTVELVSRIARLISIPFTVGGGISSAEHVYRLLSAGADKVAVNSAAVTNPALISELAREFGSQCVVVAVDTKRTAAGDEVFISAGRKSTGLSTQKWCSHLVELGAGEILLTSIDHDGCRGGFALELCREVSSAISIPLIASGGAGSAEHFREVFTAGLADAALAAGVFHEGSIKLKELKAQLGNWGIEVRQ